MVSLRQVSTSKRSFFATSCIAGGLLCCTFYIFTTLTQPRDSANAMTPSQSSPTLTTTAGTKIARAPKGHPFIDPIATLSKSSESDERLEHWIKKFADSDVPREATAEELAGLTEILHTSPIRCTELFDIARGVHAKCGCDNATAMVYEFIGTRENQELSTASIDERKDLLHSFARNREDLKHVMWPLISNDHDDAALECLSSLYSNFVVYVPPDDKNLQSILPSEKIGLIECLWLKHRNPEALKLIIDVSHEKLAGERKSSLELMWGRVLFALGDVDNALIHARTVATSKSSNSEVAWTMMMKWLISSNQFSRAESVVEEYKTQNKYDPKQLKTMEDALAYWKPQ